MKSYFCSTVSPILSLWTQGEGTAWTEVKQPGQRSNILPFPHPWPCPVCLAPGALTPLPAQTHRPPPPQDTPTEQADPRLQRIHCSFGKLCVHLKQNKQNAVWAEPVSCCGWMSVKHPGLTSSCWMGVQETPTLRINWTSWDEHSISLSFIISPCEGPMRLSAVERDDKEHKEQRREARWSSGWLRTASSKLRSPHKRTKCPRPPRAQVGPLPRPASQLQPPHQALYSWMPPPRIPPAPSEEPVRASAPPAPHSSP
ncbi:uncharacterized protein LOC141578199 [Camelus bactrianus]|uniref:Uncharacterized protein LOC141578199 n=1 Tax=Camelus bactrianus TaxID=9837 RepID=A0AC58QNK9_CAMBA